MTSAFQPTKYSGLDPDTHVACVITFKDKELEAITCIEELNDAVKEKCRVAGLSLNAFIADKKEWMVGQANNHIATKAQQEEAGLR